jgi:hypothetical protein
MIQVKSSKPASWKYHPYGNIVRFSLNCTGKVSMRIMAMRQVIFDLDGILAFMTGSASKSLRLNQYRAVLSGT